MIKKFTFKKAIIELIFGTFTFDKLEENDKLSFIEDIGNWCGMKEKTIRKLLSGKTIKTNIVEQSKNDIVFSIPILNIVMIFDKKSKTIYYDI